MVHNPQRAARKPPLLRQHEIDAPDWQGDRACREAELLAPVER
jgi:hypothetical protein